MKQSITLIILSLLLFTSPLFGQSERPKSITEGDKTKGMFVTVGLSGTILTSSDGTTWTSRTPRTSNRLYGVTYSQ